MLTLLLWAQGCALPCDLVHQDSVWVEKPGSLRALSRARHKLDLREIHSKLTPPKDFFLQKAVALYRVCQEGHLWKWYFLRGEDSVCFQSRPPHPRWMRRAFRCLYGPRRWLPGHPPYREIELLLPLAPRPQTPQDTLWPLNLPYLEPFLQGWLLHKHPPQGRLSALSLTLRTFPTGLARLEKVGLLLQSDDRLPYDEEVTQDPFLRLPRHLRQLLQQTLSAPIPYAYIVRINDYYPSTLAESWSWTALWTEGRPFPRPADLTESAFPPRNLTLHLRF